MIDLCGTTFCHPFTGKLWKHLLFQHRTVRNLSCLHYIFRILRFIQMKSNILPSLPLEKWLEDYHFPFESWSLFKGHVLSLFFFGGGKTNREKHPTHQPLKLTKTKNHCSPHFTNKNYIPEIWRIDPKKMMGLGTCISDFKYGLIFKASGR